MKKILLIQTAFIGDVILATSLVETIAKYAPEARLDFLVRNGNESLLQNNPKINRIIVWNKKKKLRSLISSIIQVRKQKYDAVINVQRFMNSGLMTGLSGAKIKSGFSQNPVSFLFTHKTEHKIPHHTAEGYLHEVQRNAQLLAPVIDIKPTEAQRPKLYFNRNIEQKINEHIHSKVPYIVLAPTSVWFTKQWDFSKWKELSEKLSSHYKLFFIGAPSDAEAINQIIGSTGNCENLAGKLSLLESAKLMEKAERVFVNDSAPLHLASSVNAKTTAIFCSTVPEFGYTPLSDDSKVVIHSPRLECQPCGLHGHMACPLGHFKCALQISVNDVLNQSHLS